MILATADTAPGGAGVLQVSKQLASNLQKHLAAGLP